MRSIVTTAADTSRTPKLVSDLRLGEARSWRCFWKLPEETEVFRFDFRLAKASSPVAKPSSSATIRTEYSTLIPTELSEAFHLLRCSWKLETANISSTDVMFTEDWETLPKDIATVSINPSLAIGSLINADLLTLFRTCVTAKSTSVCWANVGDIEGASVGNTDCGREGKNEGD